MIGNRRHGSIRPIDRVRRALIRVSREKWLHPEDVSRVAMAFANRYSANPQWTANSAYAQACSVIGMIRGEPPAYPFEPEYHDYLAALRGLKKTETAAAELLILKLTIKKAQQHGR